MTDYTKCSLTRFPAAVLEKRAEPIAEINDDIRKLADRMIDLMVETQGVGFAGPQAGVNLRIFVVSLDSSRENAKVYINPEIEVSGPVISHEEGCLSLPGIYSQIQRHAVCTVTATDLEGNRFTEEGEGLLARAFQHEYDHLEGTMIKDRMSRPAKVRARRKLKQMLDDYEETDAAS
jgi:peptide deformylase